jgi:hypothetical protein
LQETSIFMMNLVLNWWHTEVLHAIAPMTWHSHTMTWHSHTSEILTAVLLKIQVFCDVNWVTGQVVPEKPKDHSWVSTLLFFLDWMTLKMKVLCSFKMSWTPHSKTQHLIPKAWIHHSKTFNKHRCNRHAHVPLTALLSRCFTLDYTKPGTRHSLPCFL